MRIALATASWVVALSTFPGMAVAEPFLKKVSDTTWTFGNDVWNATQVGNNVKKLYYKNRELVGKSAGHYYSASMFPYSLDASPM